jgi:enoyl-CoA hydratase/carnithine racemase
MAARQLKRSKSDAKPSRIDSELVRLGRNSRAAVLYLNRVEKLNALDWAMILELHAALQSADEDASIRAVLVTGRGRAFSAGGDLTSYLTLQQDPVNFPRFLADFHRTCSAIKFMRKPVVALVNGITAAGGLELVLSCDFAIAASSAQIGDAHLQYGQMGGGGVLTMLPRLIGPARARELIFSGRFLSASEALEWGLVNSVVPDSVLLDTGLEFCRGLATRSPSAVSNAKFVLNTAWSDGTGIEQSLRLERERTAYYALTSRDAQEGLIAFGEKRNPAFKGD